MRRRQLMGAGVSVLAVPTVSTEEGQRSQAELLEVVDYYILGGDPEKEYITLQNVSGEPLSMSNWTIEDDGLVPADTLSPFVFPSGFTLEPNAEVTIVTGDGGDTDETLYWGVGRQVWSEEGDIVYVSDASDRVILEQPIAGEPEVGEQPDEVPDEEPEEERPEEEEQLEEEEPVRIEVEIDETNDPVMAGDRFEVIAEVTNTGVEEGTQTIQLLVDEDRDPTASESVTVAPGETVTIIMGYDTDSVNQDREFPIYVASETDEVEQLVEVHAEEEPDISTVDATLSTTEVEVEENLEVEVTLENTGDVDGAHTVQLLVDDDVVDEADANVAASKSETVTFSHVFEERGEFGIATDDRDLGTVDVIDPNLQIITDFNWNYPECPDQEVGDLEQYFFGDISVDDFHVDDGSGARDVPDSCVLRTDAEEAVAISLPDGQEEQPEVLEHYPRRGETILFEHYVHREGANMEFRFGIQEGLESYYAVRLETEADTPILDLVRVDDGVTAELDEVTDLSYTDGQFHDFEIEWLDAEIVVTLVQDNETTTLSGGDDIYDHGGIGFYKENAGIVRSYTHLWNNVEVRLES